MKIESNKNWTTCLRLNTGDGSPRVFLLNSHFLGSVPITSTEFFFDTRNLSEEHAIAFFKKEYSSNNVEVSNLSLSELMTVKKVLK